MLVPALLTGHLLLLAQVDNHTVAAAPTMPVEGEVSLEASATPVLFAELSDEEVFDRVTQSIEAIDTLQAKFVQTSPTGSVTAGTVAMDRPGRLRFAYQEPSKQQIVATGGLVYVHDTDLETTDSYPVSQTPLRFLLADSIEDDGVVLTGVTRMPGEVAVSLRAADDDLSGEVALVLAGDPDDLVLARWAVVDPQGGVTVVELDEVETGMSLSRRLFRIPETERRFGNDRR